MKPVDHAPVFLVHGDRDGHYKYVNKWYADRLGLTPQDIIGKRIPDVIVRQCKRHEAASWNEDIADDAAERSDWNELELLDRVELVHHALGQLSLVHREVLTLRFLEELELSEIAQVVGCGVGTVKSRLHYAKAAIRQLLEEACHE